MSDPSALPGSDAVGRSRAQDQLKARKDPGTSSKRPLPTRIPKPSSTSWGMRRRVAVKSPNRDKKKKKSADSGFFVLGDAVSVVDSIDDEDPARKSYDRYSGEFPRGRISKKSKVKSKRDEGPRVITTYRQPKCTIKVRSTKTSRARARRHHGIPARAMEKSAEDTRKSHASPKIKPQVDPLRKVRARVTKGNNSDASSDGGSSTSSTIASYIDRFRNAPPSSRDERRADSRDHFTSGGGGGSHSKFWWHERDEHAPAMWSHRKPAADALDDAKIRALQRKAQRVLDDDYVPPRALDEDIERPQYNDRVNEMVKNIKLEDPDALIARLRAKLYPGRYPETGNSDETKTIEEQASIRCLLKPPKSPQATLKKPLQDDERDLARSTLEEDPEALVERIKNRLYNRRIDSSDDNDCPQESTLGARGTAKGISNGSFSLSVSSVGSVEEVARVSFAISPDASLSFDPASSSENPFRVSAATTSSDQDLRGLELLGSKLASVEVRKEITVEHVAQETDDVAVKNDDAIIEENKEAANKSPGLKLASIEVRQELPVEHAAKEKEVVELRASYSQTSPANTAEDVGVQAGDAIIEVRQESPVEHVASEKDTVELRAAYSQTSPINIAEVSGVQADDATIGEKKGAANSSNSDAASLPSPKRNASEKSPVLSPSSPFYKSPHMKHLQEAVLALDGDESNEADRLAQSEPFQRRILKRRSSWPRARRRSFPRSPLLLSPT